MWLAMKADWEAKDNGTGFWFYGMDWLVGAWFVWMLIFIDLGGEGRTLDFPWDREPWLLLGLEREGKVEMGREKGGGDKVEILINK